MVLAKFLTTHLLEPQKRRLEAKNYAAAYAMAYAEGYAAGRAETLAEVRSLLQAQGFNLDEIVLPDAGTTGAAKAQRR